MLCRSLDGCIKALPVPFPFLRLDMPPVELVAHPFDADRLGNIRRLLHLGGRPPLAQVDPHAERRVGQQFCGSAGLELNDAR